MDNRFFIITVDTEGDNLWRRSTEITTDNARYIPRFQAICERFGFYPTYLTNYEMAQSPVFCEFACDALRRNTAEIGMHLHAWNSPPFFDLTGDDNEHHPYLIEYPPDIIDSKVAFMTAMLEDVFQCAIVSHRSGRWAFDETYANILIKHRYCVDCSVTPHRSWKNVKGDPCKDGGSDYKGFPENAYFIDLHDISKYGNSGLLEVPMTIMLNDDNRLCWLRPMRDNIRDIFYIIDRAVAENRLYLEFMIHSSELMPAGSPTFPEKHDIEKLYETLETVFEKIKGCGFKGATLKSFHNYFIQKGICSE
ncbi:MAG: deacetylase [Candidatus Auribacterota bacterium]|jgi:hypothetical protein|nr:deacetylase [Candidatus Auribacterota bacterium]